jgi:heptosyltransferase-2
MTDKILVRGVNWVGDAVMTLPAVTALRKALSDRKLSLLTQPSTEAVFINNPFIDEIILYEERYRGVMGRLGLAKALNKKGFSLAILFQNAFDAAFMATLAGIPKRVGYKRDFRGFLLTDPVPFSGEDRRMHHIQYFLELLRRTGIEAETTHPWIYLDLEERMWARRTLSGLKRPIVGLNPGAAYGSAKQWPPERFAGVARRVIEELKGSAVIFGTEKEIDIADRIIGLSGYSGSENIQSLAGKTTLRELISLISECDALVSNDSGPMHLGYAVMTPLVAIFGSTDPSLTGPPEGKGSIVLKKEAPCSPCFLRECKEKTLLCMKSITDEDAFTALKNLLPANKAVFFDRDGTLNVDVDYLNKWDNFNELPELSALNELINMEFKLIGITNQSGIARGIIEEGFVRNVNAYFMEKHGLEGFYYCPHHPDENCSCRKPEPEMLLRARADHRIDLKSSYMVGDNEKDMLVARAGGAKAVLVRTGKFQESPNADFTANGLKEAVEWILKDNMGLSTLQY